MTIRSFSAHSLALREIKLLLTILLTVYQSSHLLLSIQNLSKLRSIIIRNDLMRSTNCYRTQISINLLLLLFSYVKLSTIVFIIIFYKSIVTLFRSIYHIFRSLRYYRCLLRFIIKANIRQRSILQFDFAIFTTSLASLRTLNAILSTI